MGLISRHSYFARVTALAAQRPVHAAFAWMHQNPKTIMDWQVELSTIPAPPFGEQARSEWAAARFREIGLQSVSIDEVGNVFGTLPSTQLPPESTGHVVVLSAHLDTVFPAATPLKPVLEDDTLRVPGACDNGAGVAGLLALAQALVHAAPELPVPLVLLANVGEEGEGDLRGVRYLYQNNSLAGRIAAHIVLDGAGADTAVVQALGSRRFLVRVEGPGGHSFSDAGTPNPIAALSAALASFADQPLPTEPRTTMNLGTIRGGTSVNSIPQFAEASVDIRSTSPDELIRLEVALFRAAEDAVAHFNLKPTAAGRRPLTLDIQRIGDRPAAELAADAPLLSMLRAVDRHLSLPTELRLGSTDANIPLSLGVPSLSLGAGGEGGGAHTLEEWYSAKDRELGLRRVLLLTLAMLGWAAEQ
jgi:acetylornithine deacetylase/succinyl-diaminopimelate desuccinylase-like protein